MGATCATKRALVAAVLATSFAAAAPASAGTLDQSQTGAAEGFGSFGNGRGAAQTFAPGFSGPVDQVDVAVKRAASSTCSPGPGITVQIRTTTGGLPAATVLATTTIPHASVGTATALTSATFSSPATVVAGTQYAIVLIAEGVTGCASTFPYEVAATSGNPYAAGEMFLSLAPGQWMVQGTYDVIFRTYVLNPDTTPPETTIDSGPADGSVTPETRPTFTFSSSEAGSRFDCRVDGASFSACDGGSFTPVEELGDGAHSFEVRAVDAARNADPTPAARSFTVATGANDPPPLPDLTRELALKYRRGAFRGRLTPAGGCAEGEQVAVFRKRRRKPDKAIGDDSTDSAGDFVVGAARRDGTYYATAPASEDPTGHCLATRSKGLRLD